MIGVIFTCALGLLVIGLLLLLAHSTAKRRRERFERRFPPISDAEFVARCRAGTNPEVALRVRRIVADRLGVEYDRIHPSTSARTVIGFPEHTFTTPLDRPFVASATSSRACSSAGR